jgi:hypothetical protein
MLAYFAISPTTSKNSLITLTPGSLPRHRHRLHPRGQSERREPPDPKHLEQRSDIRSRGRRAETTRWN